MKWVQWFQNLLSVLVICFVGSLFSKFLPLPSGMFIGGWIVGIITYCIVCGPKYIQYKKALELMASYFTECDWECPKHEEGSEEFCNQCTINYFLEKAKGVK